MLSGEGAVGLRAVERLAGFVGFLRNNGFAVGGGDTIEVLCTAGRVGMLDESVLRWSLQALLCGRSEEWRTNIGAREHVESRRAITNRTSQHVSHAEACASFRAIWAVRIASP